MMNNIINHILRKAFIVLVGFIIGFKSYAQIDLIVNLNVKHEIDTFSSFDRSKFITIHADHVENEWAGNNEVADLLDNFINGYDVYMGRNTGGISWNLNQVQQDPARSGFANPSEISSRGQDSRNFYASRTHLHPYESRNNLVIAGQLNPFWTGVNQQPTGQGWKLANATATGEYMGRYIKEFHGSNGPPYPDFVEVINEPAYEHFGGFSDYSHSIEEIAQFHIDVADAIRVQVPDVKIGGYTTAFPNFEIGDFQRWENRWKLFMDMAGDKMDFWSIHLYDFPSINNGKVRLRSGSNIEATFDLMEHYSMLSFDEVKPFVISEFGAQMHDYSGDQWTPFRDWLHIKSLNSQLMSFLERPNYIEIAVNFLIVKAEWGYWNGVPYNHRLMRKENEPNSYTGNWVYTDMVKFYQLWKNVKGVRVDSKSEDLDIQLDAYVDGVKAYIIINNLEFQNIELDLKLLGIDINQIEGVMMRHLTLEGNLPVLHEIQSVEHNPHLVIGAESTIILEYSLSEDIQIDETSSEIKYYAENYLQDIVTDQVIDFSINDVETSEYGEAVLRIGIGRPHGKSLKPLLHVNNNPIYVPEDWRGYDQKDRDWFYGVIEIPVPIEVIGVYNDISLEFPDSGGKVSSVAMQVFKFTSNIRDFSSSVHEEIPDKYNISIFPNPTKDYIRLNVEEALIGSIIELLNMEGKTVRTETLDSSDTKIDMSGLRNGMYMLSFYKKGELLISKPIIKD